MDCGHIPNDGDIHVRIVVGHDVSHAAHLPEGKFGDRDPSLFGQVGRGFADDFDSPNDRVLFFDIRRNSAGDTSRT